MAWVVAGVMLATFIYSMYMQSKMNSGIKPHEVAGPTASEGIAIPVVFGSRRVDNVNVTLSSNPRSSSLGNGKFSYRLAMQLGICHGKVDALLGMTYADKPCLMEQKPLGVYEGRALTVNPAWNATTAAIDNISGFAQFYPGIANSVVDAGQWSWVGSELSLAPDPVLGGSFGPLPYGVAQAFLHQCDFGSPYIGAVSFMVKRIHTRHCGTAVQWYDAKAEIPAASRARTDNWHYRVQAASDNTDWSGDVAETWAEGPGGIGNAPAGFDLAREFGASYPLPVVGTQLPADGVMIRSRDYPNSSVQIGTKLWLRKSLPSLPVYPLNIRCWHDDSAKLWFNGHEIPLTPTKNSQNNEYQHFNSTAVIPKEYINTWTGGSNLIVYRVTDSYDQSGNRIGTNKFIYAGLQIGVDDDAPAGAADMNPAHIIHEVLTDAIWGMGYTDADLDDAAFRAAADTLYAEGLGLSFVWSQQMSIEDFLTDVLRHISGVLYVDRTTGLFVLKLIREDYDVEDLVVLDESNISKVEELSRKQIGELVNYVTVTYSATMRGDQGSVSLPDEGMVQAQGGTVAQKIDYPAITSPVNAAKLMLRDLRLLSSPLMVCKLVADRAAASLNIGSPFVLNRPDLGINNFVMRVTEINLGNGIDEEVKVSCMEDVFFFPADAAVTINGPISIPDPVTPIEEMAGTDNYYTAGIIDERNKGMVEFVGNVGNFESVGWVESSPGILTLASGHAGDNWQQWTDGVEPEVFAPAGSWLRGLRIFLALGGGTPSDATKKLSGPWIIDNLGGHWENYGTPSQVWVDEPCQMHRDPSFSSSPQFKKDMVFQVRNGTNYGSHYLQLNTDNVVLGSTPMDWVDVGTSFTFASAFKLLRGDQILNQTTSLDSELEITGTMVNGLVDLTAFPTLIGSFPSGYIPAAMWRFFPAPCYISGASLGSTTTLGFKVYKTGTTSSVLFEVLTEEITWTSFQAPLDILYSGAQIPINGATDQLVLIPVLHTTSTTPVTLHMKYNATNAVRVVMPKSIVDGQTSSAVDESFFPVTIDSNGAISGFGTHRNLLVSGAGPLISIDTTGLVAGVTLELTFKEATTVTGNGTPVTGAKVLTTKNAAGTYLNMNAPVNSMLTFKLRSDSGAVVFWQYSGGTNR